MIVPDTYYEPELDITSSGDAGPLHGSISGLDERHTDDRKREPIGFRMPPREPVIDDPSWMLM